MNSNSRLHTKGTMLWSYWLTIHKLIQFSDSFCILPHKVTFPIHHQAPYCPISNEMNLFPQTSFHRKTIPFHLKILLLARLQCLLFTCNSHMGPTNFCIQKRIVTQSICIHYSSLSGRPDIFLGSGTLKKRSKIWVAKSRVQKIKYRSKDYTTRSIWQKSAFCWIQKWSHANDRATVQCNGRKLNGLCFLEMISERIGSASRTNALAQMGLLSEEKVEKLGSPLDTISNHLASTLSYGPSERDMILMRHDVSKIVHRKLYIENCT